MEAEMSVMWHESRNAWSHQKLEEARNGFLPGAFGGTAALQHLAFGLLVSNTRGG